MGPPKSHSLPPSDIEQSVTFTGFPRTIMWGWGLEVRTHGTHGPYNLTVKLSPNLVGTGPSSLMGFSVLAPIRDTVLLLQQQECWTSASVPVWAP